MYTRGTAGPGVAKEKAHRIVRYSNNANLTERPKLDELLLYYRANICKVSRVRLVAHFRARFDCVKLLDNAGHDRVWCHRLRIKAGVIVSFAAMERKKKSVQSSPRFGYYLFSLSASVSWRITGDRLGSPKATLVFGGRSTCRNDISLA